MTIRRIHRIIGITMLLPFIGWAVTGFIFFIKPGYGGAYEPLSVKTYRLDPALSIAPRAEWREFRMLKTVLGTHVLARTDTGWHHLDAETLEPAALVAEAQMRALLTDAFTANAERYGTITRIAGNSVETTTGARVTLDWNRLALTQRGRDTDRVDALYRVHYLQWSGSQGIDKALGFTGLSLLIALTAFGARLAFKR